MLLWIAALLPARAAAVQLPQVTVPESVEALLPAPYADPLRSLNLLGELRRLHPDRAGLAMDAAREGAAMGVLAATPAERLQYLDSAVAAARVAVALAPSQPDAHYWLAASLGLEADQMGGRAKITRAREAYQEALRTLELDPHHAGAHHVVGRLHSGAKGLSWISRLIARGLGLGDILDQASWESAEENLRAAVKEDPGPAVYRVDLAKLLLRRGQVAEARKILEDLASRPPPNPLDAHYRDEAVEILEGMKREGGGEGADTTTRAREAR